MVSMVYPVTAVTTMVFMGTVFISELPDTAGTLFTVLGHPVTAGTPLTVVMSYFIWSDAHLGDITPSGICIEFFRGLIPALNL